MFPASRQLFPGPLADRGVGSGHSSSQSCPRLPLVVGRGSTGLRYNTARHMVQSRWVPGFVDPDSYMLRPRCRPLIWLISTKRCDSADAGEVCGGENPANLVAHDRLSWLIRSDRPDVVSVGV
jgi:hypothetical protein